MNSESFSGDKKMNNWKGKLFGEILETTESLETLFPFIIYRKFTPGGILYDRSDEGLMIGEVFDPWLKN